MICISETSIYKYPVLIYDPLEIKDASLSSVHILMGKWGASNRTIIEKKGLLSDGIILHWYSTIEKQHYTININNINIETQGLKVKSGDIISIGIAPYGKVAIWIFGAEKSVLFDWLDGKTEKDDFRVPLDPTMTLDELCEFYINNDPIIKQNLETNGLPPRDLFDNYMKQFTYRYLPLFEHWNKDEKKWSKYGEDEQETKPQFDYIEEALYDGTHDKLHDGGLLNYHEAGKPKKLAMKWHIKKSEYTAYFWFEDEAIRAVFDRFYGLHPETKTDFIIHIDPMKNKYQLALYRYGLREPQVIPEGVYQLIVFKNKFEHFRSKNYDQPRGAWIW